MNYDEIINGTVSGIIGGLVVAAGQTVYSEWKEVRKQKRDRIVGSNSKGRVITSAMFWDLKPGTSLDMMREMLGAPSIVSKLDSNVFNENDFETNSYLYFFKNSLVKITSKDKESISSLTLIPHDKSLELDILPTEERCGIINEMTVTPRLLELAHPKTHLSTIRVCVFAVYVRLGAPLYRAHTYFIEHWARHSADEEDFDYNQLLGKKICGVCISNNDENVYYIYDIERTA
jgi:hypothetical protein